MLAHIIYRIFCARSSVVVLLLAVCHLSFAQENQEKEEDKKRLVYALFDQIFDLSEEVSGNLKKDTTAVPLYNPDYNMQFFGWHPNWLGETYLEYKFNLLTSVSYYASTMYLDEHGQVAYEQDGWFSSSAESMIHMADEDSCNALLTLRCDDENVIAALLNNKEEINYCVKYISDLVTSRENVEGLTISFEAMPFGYKEEFSHFVKLMKKSLDVFDKALVIAVPPAKGNRKYDLPELNKYANQFVMLGYDYYYKGSPKAGPVAPLYRSKEFGELCIQQSVNEYISSGIPRSKFIIGLPYYGAVWKIKEVNGKKKYTFKEHMRINQIWDLLENETFEYNEDSTIVSCSYGPNKEYILYYDDRVTLLNKFKWVKSQRLAGVGMWGLGYDDGSDRMWNMIGNNFDVLKNPGLQEVVTDSIPTYQPPLTEAAAKADIIKILKQPEVQIVLGITAISFVLMGVFLGLTSGNVIDRILILDIRTYLKVMGIFLALMLLLIFIAGFVFHSETAMIDYNLQNQDLVTSNSIRGTLYNITLAGILLISLISWKAFVNFNKDVP